MAAGIAALIALTPAVYRALDAAGATLEAGMREAAKRANVPVQFNRCGSMFCGYFTEKPVHNLDDAMHADRARFAKFFHGMLQEGVYLAPSQFEAGFISTAHGPLEIEQTLTAARKVLATL
jgi:glutamate-1-semialdehyde 2,1-aminomutase